MVRFLPLTVALVALNYVLFSLLNAGQFQSPLCAVLGIGCAPVVVHGDVSPGYEGVREVFTQHFENGDEIGASFAAYVKGQKVVDLWGGYTNMNREEEWQKDTLAHVWSSSKVMEALTIAMLVDRGLLDFDEKISKYWPEFAQNGKENVTIAQLLRHQMVLPGSQLFVPYEVHQDLDKRAQVMAAAHMPVWEKVNRTAYNCFHRGHFLTEIVRRVDPKHRTINQFIQEEISPVFQSEFYYGLQGPKELEARRAVSFQPSLLQVMIRLLPQLYLPPSILSIIAPNKTLPVEDVAFLKSLGNKESDAYKLCIAPVPQAFIDGSVDIPDWLGVEIGSANGFTSASSLAKIANMFALKGKVNGKQFLSEKVWDRFHQHHGAEFDDVLGRPIAYTDGGVGWLVTLDPKYQGLYGWTGNGGSTFFWDPVRQVALSYTMNGMGFKLCDLRNVALIEKLLEIVDSTSTQ